MSFGLNPCDAHLTVTVQGALTPEEHAALRAAFWQAFALDKRPCVLVDLQTAATLDPVVISLLVGAQNLAAKEQARFGLVGVGEENRRLLHAFNLVGYFQLYPDAEAAVAQTE